METPFSRVAGQMVVNGLCGLLGKGDSILQAVGGFTLEKEWVCPVPSSQPASLFYPMGV